MACSLMKTVVEGLSSDGGEWQQATAAALCELAWMHNSNHQYEEGFNAAQRGTEIYEKHGVALGDSMERQSALAQELHAAVHLRDDAGVTVVHRPAEMFPRAAYIEPWQCDQDAAVRELPSGLIFRLNK